MNDVAIEGPTAPGKILKLGIVIIIIAALAGIGGYLYAQHQAKEARVAKAKTEMDAANADVRRAERNVQLSTQALNDVLSGSDTAQALQKLPHPSDRPPASILIQMKYAAEQSELMCHQDRVGCEQAALLRRQYQEYAALR